MTLKRSGDYQNYPGALKVIEKVRAYYIKHEVAPITSRASDDANRFFEFTEWEVTEFVATEVDPNCDYEHTIRDKFGRLIDHYVYNPKCCKENGTLIYLKIHAEYKKERILNILITSFKPKK